jgi:predicted Zn-dependent protease
MTILTQEQTKRICDRVLSLSKADECIVTVNGSRNGNIRFARNAVSTAGLIDDTSITVRVAFGKRQGTPPSTSSTTSRWKKSCAAPKTWRAWRRKIRSSCRPSPSPVPRPSNTFVKKTADIDPEIRAQAAAYSIEACRKKGLVAAGFLTDSTSFRPSPIRTACSATRP